MVLRPRYIEENNQVSLSMDVLFNLAKRSEKVCDQIFTAFETIDNYFKGKKTLAHRYLQSSGRSSADIIGDNGNPLYLKTLLFSKKKGEYEVLSIDEIEVDEYLDMMNEGKLIRTNKRNLRIIT